MVSSVCFAPLGYSNPMPDVVRFMAYVSPKTFAGKQSQEAIDFWLDFTKRMFRRPECPKFFIRKLKDNRILYRLNTKGLTYKQGLLYLTWFRYPQEFPDVVQGLYDRKVKEDTDDTLFVKLQQIHDEHVSGKFKCIWPDTGHMLMCKYLGYGGEANAKPITIERFVHNIKNPPATVHAYFT